MVWLAPTPAMPPEVEIEISLKLFFAGASGAVGHLNVCDDVVVAAKTFLTSAIVETIWRPNA